jgi:hypothetical protein
VSSSESECGEVSEVMRDVAAETGLASDQVVLRQNTKSPHPLASRFGRETLVLIPSLLEVDI